MTDDVMIKTAYTFPSTAKIHVLSVRNNKTEEIIC